MYLPNYSIMTKLQVSQSYDNEDFDFQALTDEQDDVLRIFGYKDTTRTNHLIHFFNSRFFDEFTEEMTISDAIEYLAIKDGVDLVKYDNGNMGFVAYDGTANGFEIIE